MDIVDMAAQVEAEQTSPEDTIHELRAKLACARSSAIHWHTLWLRRGERLTARASEVAELRSSRDMLARRCADQAHEIARLMQLLSGEQQVETGDVHTAIAAMQRGGVR